MDSAVLTSLVERVLVREALAGTKVEDSGFREGVKEVDDLLQETREAALALAEKLAALVDAGDAGAGPSSVNGAAERKRALLTRVGVCKVLAATCNRMFDSMRRDGV